MKSYARYVLLFSFNRAWGLAGDVEDRPIDLCNLIYDSIGYTGQHVVGKALVELHGGNIWIKSEVGKGLSHFDVRAEPQSPVGLLIR